VFGLIGLLAANSYCNKSELSHLGGPWWTRTETKYELWKLLRVFTAASIILPSFSYLEHYGVTNYYTSLFITMICNSAPVFLGLYIGVICTSSYYWVPGNVVAVINGQTLYPGDECTLGFFKKYNVWTMGNRFFIDSNYVSLECQDGHFSVCINATILVDFEQMKKDRISLRHLDKDTLNVKIRDWVFGLCAEVAKENTVGKMLSKPLQPAETKTTLDVGGIEIPVIWKSNNQPNITLA